MTQDRQNRTKLFYDPTGWSDEKLTVFRLVTGITDSLHVNGGHYFNSVTDCLLMAVTIVKVLYPNMDEKDGVLLCTDVMEELNSQIDQAFEAPQGEA